MASTMNGQVVGSENDYRRQAEEGAPDAMYNLAVLLEGRGERSEAARWYWRASRNGDVDAMFNLGGVLEDLGQLSEARHWYQRAADAGDPDAQTNLALLEGLDGPVEDGPTGRTAHPSMWSGDSPEPPQWSSQPEPDTAAPTCASAQDGEDSVGPPGETAAATSDAPRHVGAAQVSRDDQNGDSGGVTAASPIQPASQNAWSIPAGSRSRPASAAKGSPADELAAFERSAEGWKVQPPARRRTGKLVGGVVGGLIGLIIAIVVALAATNPSTRTALITPSPGGTTGSTGTSTGPNSISAWAADHASIMFTVANDAQNISKPALAGDVSGTNSACRQFQTDLGTALAAPPIPDPATASHWRAALTLYQQAAQDCITGTDDMDSSALDPAASELNEGTAEVNQATTAIDAAKVNGG